ncbi:MAG TPA: zinc-binding dehydrogenase [Acetobacteraceae bacterium]|nr:zinc-binding dehydrogenase [Acetobacteraceae bacterium]
MQAAYYLGGHIEVGEVPDPVPGKGQALVRTHACGLCASDVHFLHAGEKMVSLSREYGGPYAGIDLGKLFVPGHEYVGEVVDYGPGSRRPITPGRRVTSAPLMRQSGAHRVIGYHNECPGGFGEYMLLDEDFIIEVPAGLDDDRAAMTEPLAVGLEHARRGAPTKDDVVLVVGCGAIGLGVIAGLKLMQVGPIIAADFGSERRAIAIKMGADIAIDPRELSPYAPIQGLGMRRASLIYECAGVPGLLKQIIGAVGFGARIVMGGYCMQPEELLVFSAQNKRLTIMFAAGEEQQDMELALRSIADGAIDITPWLGGHIGLNGVAGALEAMSNPAAPVRTVVDPRRA